MSEGLERKDALWLWAIVNVRMRIGGTWPTDGVHCEEWAQVWKLWKQMYKCGNCGNANCPRARLISRGAAIQRLDMQRWSNGETLDMPSENCSRQQEQLLNRGSTTQT